MRNAYPAFSVSIERKIDSMFVRIVKGNHDALYQCDRFRVHPVDSGQYEFTITMERDGRADAVAATIDKSVPEALGVYVMNDEGRTIDTIFRKDED